MQKPWHRCDYGRANLPDVDTWQHRLQAIDPALLARKGHLHILCTRDVDTGTLATVYREYYADPCFDTVPSLQAALVTALQGSAYSSESIPLAVVIRGLEAFLVGTSHSAAWLAHIDQTSNVLERGYPLDDTLTSGADQGPIKWYGARQRLMAGDMLILSTHQVAKNLGTKSIHRMVQRRGSPQAIARRIARSSHHRGDPVLIIARSPLHPMPDMGPTQRVTVSPAQHPELRHSLRWSPVWAALLMAVVSVGAVLWIEKPQASRQDFINLVRWIVSPEPTEKITRSTEPILTVMAPLTMATSASASIANIEAVLQPTATARAQPAEARQDTAPTPVTPTPTAKYYEIAILDSPHEGENIHGRYVELRWSWHGSLAENEYFDVRLWRLGTPKSSIAWTKEPRYVERYRDGGWHTWTVAVIKGQDGIMERELVKEAEPINFDWDAEETGGASSAPTKTVEPEPTAAPTRSTPVGRPTRVTPEAVSVVPPRESSVYKEDSGTL